MFDVKQINSSQDIKQEIFSYVQSSFDITFDHVLMVPLGYFFIKQLIENVSSLMSARQSLFNILS